MILIQWIFGFDLSPMVEVGCYDDPSCRWITVCSVHTRMHALYLLYVQYVL